MSTPPATRAAGTIVPTPPLDHLSWSSISSYRSCPRRFAFSYIEHAPAERRSAALPFGSSVHRAIERLHQARLEGAPVPTAAELNQTYAAAWREETTDGAELAFGKGEDIGVLRSKAERMLAAYRLHLTESAADTQILALEHAERVQLLPDAPPLETRVDRVELVGDTLVVVDTKTSKSKWNDAKVRENQPQVVLYAFALVPMRDAVGAKRIATRYEIITKGKCPTVQIIEPEITRDDALRVRELVGETWRAIRAGVFPRRESYTCDQCPFRTRCLGR